MLWTAAPPHSPSGRACLAGAGVAGPPEDANPGRWIRSRCAGSVRAVGKKRSEDAPPRRLTLLRHAKSAAEGKTDFDRPLAPRGLRDAPETGRRMARWDDTPTLVVASDARRAAQTLEAVRAAFEDPPPVEWDSDLYLAGTGQILATVTALDPRHRHVLLVGHNPGFTDFANRFADAGLSNLPTCGVVRTRLWVPEWSDAGWGCASVELVDTPKAPAG